MRSFPVLVLLSAVFWGGLPALPLGIDGAGTAFAESGSSGSSHDEDGDDDADDDDDNSGGSGSSGSGNSGSGGSGSGNSGSDDGPDASRGGELFGHEGLSVRYSDGHVERVRDGLFESLDSRGRVVASHPARHGDVERLQSLGEGGRHGGGSRIIEALVEIGESGRAIAVTDYRGWKETVARGAYVVKDPSGRTVIRRPVTESDIARLREMLGLD